MDLDKIREAVLRYDQLLEQWNYEEKQHADGGQSRVSRLEHVRYMCSQVPIFIVEGRIEKANRWLGFIQGVLFSHEVFSLAELKEHNKPPDPPEAVADE